MFGREERRHALGEQTCSSLRGGLLFSYEISSAEQVSLGGKKF
jgi:hypothetical protein